MPDITMCTGEGCPLKQTCWRYIAKPSEWQCYFTEVPLKDGKCDYYVYSMIWEKPKDNTDEREEDQTKSS